MRIALIWAMARNRVIGRDQALPWHLPDEMRHFVRTTRGKPVIMGRRQWEAMPRALPGRANIVVTRQRDFDAPGATVVHDIETAFARAATTLRATGTDEAMVIGGAEIYALALPFAHRLYETVIDAELPGDTFFPDFDVAQWQAVSHTRHDRDDRHAYPFTIIVLDRRTDPPCPAVW